MSSRKSAIEALYNLRSRTLSSSSLQSATSKIAKCRAYATRVVSQVAKRANSLRRGSQGRPNSPSSPEPYENPRASLRRRGSLRLAGNVKQFVQKSGVRLKSTLRRRDRPASRMSQNSTGHESQRSTTRASSKQNDSETDKEVELGDNQVARRAIDYPTLRAVGLEPTCPPALDSQCYSPLSPISRAHSHDPELDEDGSSCCSSIGKRDIEFLDNSDSFKKIPELREAFCRTHFNTSRNATNVCIGCNWKTTTNEIDRLAKHASKCKKLPQDLKEALVTRQESIALARDSTCSNDEIATTLTSMIVADNLPLRIVESKWFRSFVCKLNPHWPIPSRREISSSFLPFLARKYASNLSTDLKIIPDYSLSVEFDHWSELTHKSLLAVIFTKLDGQRYLLKLEDVSSTGHGTYAILGPLRDALSQISLLKINAIVSDSASSCKRARQDLLKEEPYEHIIEHRCLAHFINLIGQHFSKQASVSDIMETATKLCSLINNSRALSIRIKEAGLRKVEKACQTRWYSQVNMLETLSKVYKVVKAYLDEQDEDNETSRLVNCLDFWTDLVPVVGILRPLANCISIAESKECPMGEAIKALLMYVKSLFDMSWDDPHVLAAIRAFLSYFNEDKLGKDELALMLTSYCLDRRNCVNFLRKEGLVMVFATVCQIALKTGFKPSFIDKILHEEFEKFCHQTGSLSRIQDDNESAHDWWRRMPDTGILRKVGLRVASLKASSANVERLFSMLKLIQGHSRTNFNLETLTSLAQTKLALADPNIEAETAEVLYSMKSINLGSQESIPEGQCRSTITTIGESTRIFTGRSSSHPHRYKPEKLGAPILVAYFRDFTRIIDFEKLRERKQVDEDEPSASSCLSDTVARFKDNFEF